jgi:hypothetical protein
MTGLNGIRTMTKYKNIPCYLDLDNQAIIPVSEAPNSSGFFNFLKFDSKFEAKVFVALKELSRELSNSTIAADVLVKPTQVIWVNQVQVCTYTPDFQVSFEHVETGDRLRILTFEAKGYLTETATLKYKLAVATKTINKDDFFLVVSVRKRISPFILTLSQAKQLIINTFNNLQGEKQ